MVLDTMLWCGTSIGRFLRTHSLLSWLDELCTRTCRRVRWQIHENVTCLALNVHDANVAKVLAHREGRTRSLQITRLKSLTLYPIELGGRCFNFNFSHNILLFNLLPNLESISDTHRPGVLCSGRAE